MPPNVYIMKRQPRIVSCGGRSSTITATICGGCHFSPRFRDQPAARPTERRVVRAGAVWRVGLEPHISYWELRLPKHNLRRPVRRAFTFCVPRRFSAGLAEEVFRCTRLTTSLRFFLPFPFNIGSVMRSSCCHVFQRLIVQVAAEQTVNHLRVVLARREETW
jgi:hypothetical protein